MGMTLKPIFVVCMFSALHQLWHIDLSMLAGAILFPKSWRSFPNDVFVLVLSFSLLCLLQDYESWRYWYPIMLFHPLEALPAHSVALFSNHIEAVSEGDYSRFLAAVLLGDKNGISTENTELFRALGISHVLAISGFHIGFWVVCIRPLFFWAKSPLMRGGTLIVQFVILYYYALMVGASASVLRAVWMFLFARFATLGIQVPLLCTLLCWLLLDIIWSIPVPLKHFISVELYGCICHITDTAKKQRRTTSFAIQF